MAIKFEDLANFVAKELIPEILADKTLQNQLGQEAVESIRRRTRLGKGVSEVGASAEKLKALADSTVKRRARNKSSLSGDTRPKKSNLTETGEMLDSLTYTLTNDGIEVGFTNGGAQDKARFAAEKGRPFLNLSAPELKRLNRLIREFVRQKFQR